MDFRHVRAFIAVADTLSVTKAAERLHISQPPLSRHIHQLEEELGTALFVRHHHGVTLTESGRLLLEKARVLEAAASDFCDTARRAACGELGTIRIGIGWGLWEDVNKVRLEFARRRPGVAIEARDAFCATKSNERLRTRELDLVFARPPFDTSFSDVHPIYEEPLQAVLSDGDPLASRTSVSIRDLAGRSILLWDRHVAPVVYDRVVDLCARLDSPPTLLPTPGAGPYNNAGLMLVASGRGVYICLGVPLTSPHALSGVAVVPLSDPDATVDVCVASRKNDTSPAIEEFLDCVRHVFPGDDAHEAIAIGVRAVRARSSALRAV
jgi:DNA-binding transcriptional LysR family regulator